MDSKRRVLGWAAYDWAGSAYLTSVATALLPAYFAAVVAPQGLRAFGHTLPAASLWGYAVSLSAALVLVLAPVLSAAAERGAWRRRALAACCLLGGAAACLTGLTGAGDVAATLGLFVAAHVAYSAGNAFYDSYLPQLAPFQERDRVSGLGYAFGYVGGGVHLALALGLVAFHDAVGLSKQAAVQAALASGGLWWVVFGLASISLLPGSSKTADQPAGLVAAARTALADTLAAARLALADRNLRTFYLAFFFYNDAIGTVISMATIYGKDELGLSETVLLLTLLAIQGVALCGALLFSRLAAALSGKTALMIALSGWTGLAVCAGFIETQTQYFMLGLCIGLALGGSQALSRSVFSRLVPTGGATVYFGFYSVLVKLSAIFGPLLFAVVRQATGSSRPAILSLVVFFVVGLALLSRVREVQRAA